MVGDPARTRRVSHAIGVCSWSLQPRDAADLLRKLGAAGANCVQLALAPFHEDRGPRMDAAATARALLEAGIALRSGMMSTLGEDYSTLETIRRTGGVRPDATWAANLEIAAADALLARQLGIPLVTFHAGFLPHDPRDPERKKLVERLRIVVDRFADHGVRVGFETGQESAETLLEFLADLDRKTAGVNFDPANMILYGMGDPVAALRKLGPHVLQVHIKDARPAEVPGTWGKEVAVGTGAVDWKAFFSVLEASQPGVDLMIEREAGGDRLGDIVAARKLVQSILEAA